MGTSRDQEGSWGVAVSLPGCAWSRGTPGYGFMTGPPAPATGTPRQATFQENAVSGGDRERRKRGKRFHMRAPDALAAEKSPHRARYRSSFKSLAIDL